MPLRGRCFSSTKQSRAIVKTIRPPAGARILTQPLTFLTFNNDPIGRAKFADWSSRFASQGYESQLVEMHPHSHVIPSAEQASFEEMGRLGIETIGKHLEKLEEEYIAYLRASTTSPFPSLLFSHSMSTLLAETYVSSHPLSGMVLCSPPSLSDFGQLGPFQPSQKQAKDFEAAATSASSTPLGPTQDLFNYEPGFPIAITLPHSTAPSSPLPKHHRLLRDFGDDGEENVAAWIEGPIEEQNWQRVMDWMDVNRF